MKLLLSLVAQLTLLAVYVTSVPDTNICHSISDRRRRYIPLTVDSAALPAHLAHGDLLLEPVGPTGTLVAKVDDKCFGEDCRTEIDCPSFCPVVETRVRRGRKGAAEAELYMGYNIGGDSCRNVAFAPGAWHTLSSAGDWNLVDEAEFILMWSPSAQMLSFSMTANGATMSTQFTLNECTIPKLATCPAEAWDAIRFDVYMRGDATAVTALKGLTMTVGGAPVSDPALSSSFILRADNADAFESYLIKGVPLTSNVALTGTAVVTGWDLNNSSERNKIEFFLGCGEVFEC